VYHQYRTKDEIVLAVAEHEFAPLEVAVDLAYADDDRERAREVLLGTVIDNAVTRRRSVRALEGDPVLVRLMATHEPFAQLTQRLYAVLFGDVSEIDARVHAAVFFSAIGGAAVHPLVADLDDDTLRAELMRLARRLFDLAY